MNLRYVLYCYFYVIIIVMFCSITVWPGYMTSIRQYEKDILLNVETTHKFLRDENMLDIISRKRNELSRRNLPDSKVRNFA